MTIDIQTELSLLKATKVRLNQRIQIANDHFQDDPEAEEDLRRVQIRIFNIENGIT